jgi:hypothetical protein
MYIMDTVPLECLLDAEKIVLLSSTKEKNPIWGTAKAPNGARFFRGYF